MMLASSDFFMRIGECEFLLPRPQQASKSLKNAVAIWRKIVGGRPRFVSFFLFQFAFCPFMQYLCNGKRSTQVLLFLCPESPHSSQGDFPPYFAGCHPARMAVHKGPF